MPPKLETDRSASEPESEEPLGWRYVPRTRPDGTEVLDEVPLTLEDVLHPEEGDYIVEKSLHVQERQYMGPILRLRETRVPGGLILCECLINWDLPGVRNLAPDVAAFANVQVRPDPDVETFYRGQSGGDCLFTIEQVSPRRRDNDVVCKVIEYHDAGVPLYIVVDQLKERGPRKIHAYQAGPVGYEPIPLDAQGRVALGPLGLLLGLRHNRLVLFDADTGAPIGEYGEVDQARRDAEAQAEQAVKAQIKAERKVKQEAQARQQAERQAQQEAQARQQAEKRLRELEAELQRLRKDRPS